MNAVLVVAAWVCKTLLRSRSDPDAISTQNMNGNTAKLNISPLMKAVKLKAHLCVRTLIKGGANPVFTFTYRSPEGVTSVRYQSNL